MIAMVEQKRYIYWQQRLREQGPQILIPLLSLMLILLTAQGSARLSWRLFDLVRPSQQGAVSTTAAGPVDSGGIARPERTTPAQELTKLHLFGQAGSMTGATLPNARDLPQTTLRLALIGVIFSSNQEKAVAIIQEKESTTEAAIYRVGDQLPGSSVLREILTDRVILLRAGNHEILLLEDLSSTAAPGMAKKTSPTVDRAARRGETRPRPPSQPREDDDDEGNGGNDTGASLNINREDLNERIADLQALASEISAEVYQVEGAQQGYRLQAGSGSELLGQLGLKSGDILTEVNGMPLNSAGDAMQAYTKAKNEEMIQIQFIRDGKPQTVEYFIGQP